MEDEVFLAHAVGHAVSKRVAVNPAGVRTGVGGGRVDRERSLRVDVASVGQNDVQVEVEVRVPGEGHDGRGGGD